MILSTKDLVFRERPTKKLTERYVGPYVIEKVVSKNVVKLKLLTSMRIYPVVNMSKVVKYREPGKRQKVEKPKLVEVDEVEEWKVEKILNKKKIWEYKVDTVLYLCSLPIASTLTSFSSLCFSYNLSQV